jgi:hypothetical protein
MVNATNRAERPSPQSLGRAVAVVDAKGAILMEEHDLSRRTSAPAKVVRQGDDFSIVGVAWGAPIASVQVRIDNGPWAATKLIGPSPPTQGRGFAWRFWTYAWETPTAGEHTVTSRAFDGDGNVQPAPDDPFLSAKHTYWESNGQITRRVKIP